jgi:hypothetical protein
MRVLIVLVPAACLLIPATVHAQWSVRLAGTYQDTEYGNFSSRTSTQELTARRRLTLGEETSLAVTAHLLHDNDFLAKSGLYRGYGDADFRSHFVDLFYRLRPDQRTTPPPGSSQRLEEQSWGGALHLESGPELRYRDASRWMTQTGAIDSRARTRDQRLDSSWRLFGLDLDYTYHRADTRLQESTLDPGSVPVSATRDHSAGVGLNRSFFNLVQFNGSYRRSEARAVRSVLGTSRTSSDRSETQLSAQPWQSLAFNANAGWTESRTRLMDRPRRLDRYLDGTAAITYRPVPSAGFSVTRSYQQQRSSGSASSEVDGLQAQFSGWAALSPELKFSGTASHSEILSSRDTSTPSDQLMVGLGGALRPGADLSLTFSGTRLTGVPGELRYQLSENMELRLRPMPAWLLNFSAQAYKLGSSANPSAPDRISYRVDSQFIPAAGGSFSVAYSSRVVRQGTAGEKYSLSGTASVPWRGNSFSWSLTGSPPGNQRAAARHVWSYSSSAAAGLRLSRRLTLSISQSRTLPAVGAGSQTWTASFQESIR